MTYQRRLGQFSWALFDRTDAGATAPRHDRLARQYIESLFERTGKVMSDPAEVGGRS